MRKVKVFKREYDKDTHKPYRAHVYDGWFHCFSTDYDLDSDNGSVQYPVAIVESIDGKIHVEYAHMIEFIDEIIETTDLSNSVNVLDTIKKLRDVCARNNI